MIKNHKHISSIKFEFYWYGPIHIWIQPGFPEIGMPPYARIHTAATVDSNLHFDGLYNSDNLEEITKDEFNSAVKRALDIIYEINDNL